LLRARPPLATIETQLPMPRLPGLGLGLAWGLGRAALHDATALVTAAPWLEAAALEDELEVLRFNAVVPDPPPGAPDVDGGTDVCEAIRTAVPPPAASPAAASAVTSLKLSASGILVRPTSRSRREVPRARYRGTP
jgi:hypothetical protein